MTPLFWTLENSWAGNDPLILHFDPQYFIFGCFRGHSRPLILKPSATPVDPMSVEVTCVTLPKDQCVQVPWQYINVCGYSDQFCKIPHTYIHTTYRMSDHIVSYWTQFRRDKNNNNNTCSALLPHNLWVLCMFPGYVQHTLQVDL